MVALATACVAATGITVGGVSAWQSSVFADDARTDVEDLVAADLTQTANGVYDVVATQGASTAAKVDSDLAVAQHVLAQAGGGPSPSERGPLPLASSGRCPGGGRPGRDPPGRRRRPLRRRPVVVQRATPGIPRGSDARAGDPSPSEARCQRAAPSIARQRARL